MSYNSFLIGEKRGLESFQFFEFFAEKSIRSFHTNSKFGHRPFPKARKQSKSSCQQSLYPEAKMRSRRASLSTMGQIPSTHLKPNSGLDSTKCGNLILSTKRSLQPAKVSWQFAKPFSLQLPILSRMTRNWATVNSCKFDLLAPL